MNEINLCAISLSLDELVDEIKKLNITLMDYIIAEHPELETYYRMERLEEVRKIKKND